MIDAVVVGAGIAGLAAAWELRQRGLRPLVLEQSARAGGVIVTERTGGFVIDGGPDALLAHKPAALTLCEELGLGERLVSVLPPRTAFIVRRGQLIPLPEASFLGLPTRLRALATSPLFSWRGRLRMATELVRPPRVTEDESIGSFIRRRFGDEAVEYLAEPLLAGIHAGDVDALSVHALFPRLVELERSAGSVLRGLLRAPAQASPRGAFQSLRGGLAELPDALAGALGAETIRYGARVREIATDAGRRYALTLENGETITARAVIVAVPAWAAGPMLRALDADLAALCESIPYASTVTVALALRREQVRHPLRGTGFVVPRAERKAITAATWSSSKWPGRAPEGHVLLRAFLGGAGADDVLERRDEALVAAALGDLASLLGVSGDPLFARVFRWPRATPQYVVGHAARLAALDAHLARHPGLLLTGSAYRGTGIPDCVADARATAVRTARGLHG